MKKCNYVRKDLNIWGELVTKLAMFRQVFYTANAVGDSRTEAHPMTIKEHRKLCFRVEQLLVNAIKLMPENFKIPDLKYFFMSTFVVDNPSELLFADFQKIVEFSEIGFAMLLKEVINDATNEWRNFVRGELGKGGGALFRYISPKKGQAGPKVCSSFYFAEPKHHWG